MIDVEIYESGDGGEMRLRGNTLSTVAGLENQPYLACFSGEGWWGNTLLIPNRPDLQYFSNTERTLREVPLTSAGRRAIEQAMLADLAYLKKAVPGTTISVSATITSDDRVEMNVTINGKDFAIQWNPAEEQLTYQL